MGFLLPALTAEKFETQREVVLNERRQNYENRPYGLVPVALMAALYPPPHPYHWLTIGDPDDVRAAGLADVKAFFAAHYHPANASLAIAGDVRTAAAFEAARRYFGDIAAGPRPASPPPPPEPRPAGEQRLLLVDQRRAAAPVPRVAHAAAVRARRRGVRPAGRDSRRGQVRRGSTAPSCTTGRSPRTSARVRARTSCRAASPSSATAAPGHGLAELEAVIADELGALRTAGPTADEVERTRTSIEADFVYQVQTVGGFGRPFGSAQRLQRSHGRSRLRPDRPGALRGRDAGRYPRDCRDLPGRRPCRAERRAGRPNRRGVAGLHPGASAVGSRRYGLE